MEATFRSSVGLASGIDSQSIIDSLTSIRRIPIGDIQQKIDKLKLQKEAFGLLTTRMLTAKLSFSSLRQTSTFNQKSIDNSDESILGATANSGTPVGTYSFEVAQTATSHTARSNGFATSDETSIGAGTIKINFGGRDLNNGTDLDLLNSGTGMSRGSIQITDRAGASTTVDLSRSVDLQEVLDSINNSASTVTASIDSSGERILLSDSSGGGGNLIVEEVNGGSTAADLGIVGSVSANTLTGNDILNLGEGLAISNLNDGLGVNLGVVSFTDGDGNNSAIDFRDLNTLGDIIDEINNDGSLNLTAGIDADGNTITITDSSVGGGNLIISDTFNSTAADLGIEVNSAVASVTSDRIIGGLNTVLLKNIAGANETGIDLSGISVTSRDGTGPTAVSFAGAETLFDVVDAINSSGASVTASINDKGNGIKLIDNTGSTANNLIIEENGGTSASDLGIFTTAAGISTNNIDGGDIDMAIFSAHTKLSSLNGNEGVPEGSFTIKNSDGTSFEIELDSDEETLGDIVEKINVETTGITASINATGDGLRLVDTAGGTNSLTVVDGSDGTAKSLNLIGGDVQISSTEIDGSYDFEITTTADDTLETLETKIDNLNIPINAAILNTGAGASPYRLSINGTVAGESARLTIDTDINGLGFSDTTIGRDAVVFMGVDGEASNPLMIKYHSNKVQNVLPGLSLDVKKTSDDAVTLNISKDTQNIVDKMTEFTDTMNEVITAIQELTKFEINEDEDNGDDDTSEEEEDNIEVGILQGNSVARRMLDTIYDIVTTPVEGLSGSYTGFYSVGVRLGSDGQLNFDEERLQEVLDSNPEEVENLFTFSANVASSSLGGYVTTSSTDATFDAQNVVNGNTDTASFGATNGWRDSTPGSFPDTLTVNFGQYRDISVLNLFHLDTPSQPVGSHGLKDFVVEYYDQVTNQFKVARDVSNNENSNTRIFFPSSINTNQIRINVTAAHGSYSNLVEIQAEEQRGLASRINSELDDVVNSIDGLIFRETDRIDTEIVDLEERIEDIEGRALNQKLRLQRQFDAMETALSSLQTQSSAFSGLLSGLPS